MEAPLLPVSTAAASSSSVDIDDVAADAVPAPRVASSSPSTQSVVFRVVAVIAIACASLFAQHEAAKGFGIDVVSAGAQRGGDAGRRFDLFFVSNGRAERILQYASRGVERALFPDASFPRKHVRRVTVRMAGHNLTAGATVDAAAAPGEYVISLSPALVSGTGSSAAGDAAAAAEVAATPLSSSASDDGGRRCMSARFLGHLERQRQGFVARLNRAMRDRWSDAAVDAALGAPARHACAAYRAATSSTGGQDGHRRHHAG